MIPEEEEEQGIENLFEEVMMDRFSAFWLRSSEKVMMENFPNLMREKVTQIQEADRVPIKRNPKKPTPRHITIKMAKLKDK